MSVKNYVNGLQHIGVPTNDIEKTIAFYESLGFECVMRTVNEAAKEPVAFLEMQGVMIETYQNNIACGVKGALDHVALDVTDIEKVFDEIRRGGYKMLDEDIQFLPFWDRGVRFFTIEGPNGEKVEFGQKL